MSRAPGETAAPPAKPVSPSGFESNLNEAGGGGAYNRGVRRTLIVPLLSLGTVAAVAATSSLRAALSSDPVGEAKALFGVTGLDQRNYYLGGGGYSTGLLGIKSEAYAEFVAKRDNTDRVTIRVERQLPWTPWRLSAIDR